MIQGQLLATVFGSVFGGLGLLLWNGQAYDERGGRALRQRATSWLAERIPLYSGYLLISGLLVIFFALFTGLLIDSRNVVGFLSDYLSKGKQKHQNKRRVFYAKRTERKQEIERHAGQLSVIKKNAGGLSLSNKTNKTNPCKAE